MEGKKTRISTIISGTVVLLAITVYSYNRFRDWKFNKTENKNECDNEAPHWHDTGAGDDLKQHANIFAHSFRRLLFLVSI